MGGLPGLTGSGGGGLVERLVIGLSVVAGGGLFEAGDREGQGVEGAFEIGDAGFEGVWMGGRNAGVGQHLVDGGAYHFRDVAEPTVEAELPKAIVLFQGEAEAHHTTAGFEGHRLKLGVNGRGSG